MKIAILYICTGKYEVFWKDFYESIESSFFKNNEKKYFIFTDSNKIKQNDKITIINKECRGFPNDSLFRFDMFLEVENEMSEFDYVFFFNANMLLLENVGFEIFPNEKFKGLIGVTHPMGSKYKKFPSMYTYERNKKSKAYIKKENKPYNYFMGGFNGGSVVEYYLMVKECSRNIHSDFDKNIIAIFHDESHLNKYFSQNQVHILPTDYGYPEGSNLPFDMKVIIRDKTLIDEDFDKHKKESKYKRLLRYIEQVYRALTW